MTRITYIEAGRRALAEEMTRDPMVWAVGEDLGRGGVFGQYKGLTEQFGSDPAHHATGTPGGAEILRKAPRRISPNGTEGTSRIWAHHQLPLCRRARAECECGGDECGGEWVAKRWMRREGEAESC